jgi:hypothetical protein
MLAELHSSPSLSPAGASLSPVAVGGANLWRTSCCARRMASDAWQPCASRGGSRSSGRSRASRLGCPRRRETGFLRPASQGCSEGLLSAQDGRGGPRCLLPPPWPLGAPRRSMAVCKTAGPGPLHVRAADGDGVNRQAGARVSSPVEAQKAKVKNRFCKPGCKPDAAGQAETGEMYKAGDDFAAPVGRGQRR